MDQGSITMKESYWVQHVAAYASQTKEIIRLLFPSLVFLFMC